MSKIFSKGLLSQVLVFLGTTLLVGGSAIAAIPIDQQPLLVAKPVPGNMAIIGSFEFPTMVTRAYNTAAYTESTDYVGYFNNNRCYEYIYDDEEPKRHFSPVAKTGKNCSSNDKYWSGNFLNWASMQSIDIFRHVLTGGHRSIDTTNTTLLEKGVQTGQGNSGSNFKDGLLNNTSSIVQITPVKAGTNDNPAWTSFYSRVGQDNYAMKSTLKFSQQSNLSTTNPTPYNPAIHSLNNTKNGWWPYRVNYENTVYEVSIRVKVCAPGMEEDNCQKYPNNKYKPTGLIQEYAEKMRYSAFGYLNDNSNTGTYGKNRNRKGGIMHARMKYVGPNRVTDANTETVNTNREWDATTGIFVLNPDPTDAAATPFGATKVTHSGVISYINRSGHIVSGTEFKRFDNVSELFYTAYRYMKGLPNIAAYTDVSDKSGVAKDKLIGGIPVISDWRNATGNIDSPIQFSCQKNFILGIGDTNTHNDSKFVDDGKADDLFLQDKRFDDLRTNMHNREKADGNTVNVSGDERTDYIAVLAYDAHTADLRPDMPGKQTASTYWIDILEGALKNRSTNAYWLTAKYGGFKVPETFDRTAKTPLNDSLWWTSGDKLPSTNDKRPDNFYIVDKAQDLIDGLVQAFANIQLEQTGNRASLTLNSTQLEEGSMTFQARYISGVWTGNIFGYDINKTTGALSSEPKWNAESKLPAADSRKVYIDSGGLKLFKTVGKNLTDFDQDKVNYLLGNRSKETDGTFRARQGILGDFVNSQPIYVAKPRLDIFNDKSFAGSSSYLQWAKSAAIANRTPTVYIGGNDGMLHGFRTDTGVETFAFIPKTVVENGLSELTDKNYEHRYFVDGEITVGDAYINGGWKSVLIGTLGAGGVAKDRKTTNNAVFALDITNPNDVKFLWEKSSADIPDLGVNLGKPVIIQDTSQAWKVVLGNGPNSTAGKASLISIDLASGTSSTLELSTATNNGLSSVRAWDSTGDGLTDTIYAGDLQGGVWKITKLINKVKLFTAKDPSGTPQPITATPLVGKSPYDKTTWLFFGTGQYLSTNDLGNKQVQSWYGIKDNGSNDKQRSSLLERKILAEQDITTPGGTQTARVIQEGTREDLISKQGWYIDLYRIVNNSPTALGERMITQNQFQGSALISNTRIPDATDPCAPSGVGMIMSINPFTGARLSDAYFDFNNDGLINNADLITVNGIKTVASGIGFETGFSNPSFLGDKMYIPTDEGTIREFNIQPYASVIGRTSWRELINTED
ncbi:pilus assembly protein [Denitrificimonas caeni]|uniref:pilus assembly protein n=1 Tax=Denitrificimonas caeni TaxID=521720 RepID=UPI001965FB66|nr:PilC/PilY family type IV pilus protein [Denitrificimonas caeni]